MYACLHINTIPHLSVVSAVIFLDKRNDYWNK
jgi:hypothetical protein